MDILRGPPALAATLPLKLGLMRASYPDVLPISLSRKSEGDSCGPALPGGFISSLQELSLTWPGEGSRVAEKHRMTEDLGNSQGGNVRRGVVGGKKKKRELMRI